MEENGQPDLGPVGACLRSDNPIIDAVLGEHDAHTVAAMDLRMLLSLGVRERSLAGYEALALAAGMTIAAETPLPLWGRAIIDCRLQD